MSAWPRKYRLASFLFAASALCGTVAAQGPAAGNAKIAFYNVENLYDTIPSLFYDDSDYTPQGRLGWDTGRYRTKLRNIASVIDELRADVVGLSEVENEGVVRDLTATLSDDYNYIHYTGGDRRGMDLALLYRGDRFVPLSSRLVSVGAAREVLYVRGELLGLEVGVVVCHMPSQFNDNAHRFAALSELYSFVDSLHRTAAEPRVVLMGDFNAEPSDKVMKRSFGTGGRGYDLARPVYSPFEPIAKTGSGSYAYNGRWQLIDNIFISTGFLAGPLKLAKCGIFVRRQMLSQEAGSRNSYPLRTFTSGRYTAGYSDHLPVYAVFEKPE